MSSLSKAILVENLVSQNLYDKETAKVFVALFFEELREQLANGKNIKLSGFGNFILRDKVERPGRDPKTGKSFPISARRVVTFKTGLKFKRKLQKLIDA